MAEIILNPLPRPAGISYSERQLASFAHPHSRLKAVEPGDTCCNCGHDCDGDGFAWNTFTAKRINGHPICSRPKCIDAQMDEYQGRRDACLCGRRSRANS